MAVVSPGGLTPFHTLHFSSLSLAIRIVSDQAAADCLVAACLERTPEEL
jgi:hypothetical protein